MDLHSILHHRQIVHSDPEIMSGVPVFVGARVPLQTFFDYLDDEAGLAEFVADYPYLKDQAIRVLEAIAQVMLSQQRQTNARSA